MKRGSRRSGAIFEVDAKQARLKELTAEVARDGFWDAPEATERVLRERKAIGTFLGRWSSLESSLADLRAYLALAGEAGGEGLTSEIEQQIVVVDEALDAIELERMLSGENDALNAIATIHAGAGGTESQDWAEMLLRMYSRFADRNGYAMELVERQEGDEAGIKSATFLLSGDHPYGYLKAETGVHRLVRISPFDANKRRHTSFASVFVSPEIDDNVDIKINESDLKIDTLRSGGAGGQHVNKVESAVRFTHIPTGVVVLCQQERSQGKNRALAMKILRSKLYELEMRQRAEKVNEEHKAKKDIAWGSQIRSYVLAPYRMVKDHRTGHETGNVDAVLDGEIMEFIRKLPARRRSGRGNGGRGVNETWNDLMKERFLKIGALRSGGRNPWPNDQAPGWTNAGARAAAEGRSPEELVARPIRVDVAGRVMGLRRFGKAAFLVLSDRSGRLQAYLKKDHLGEEAYDLFLKSVDAGDIVWVDGPLFLTRTGELTVEAARFRLLTKAIRPLPEKWHGLSDIETRYRQRYVDLIVNEDVREIFRRRARIVSFLRYFLTARDFLEVETPMMQTVAGGATARPFVTHHNALDMDLYLRIAPELYLKRLLVGGFERVFEINRNFRNEGIDTQHNPEFTMIEFYQAYATYTEMMELTEEMLSSLATYLFGAPKFTYQGETIDFTPPWERLTVAQAAARHGGFPEERLSDEAFLRETAAKLGIEDAATASPGNLLVAIYEEVAEKKIVGPTFVTEYPIDVSPLSRRNDERPEIVDRFELIVRGREIANAFSELNDPVDQRERFDEQLRKRERGDEEAHFMDEDYLRALEHGMPPAAGEGIGIDRLVMLLTDSPSIRDVILFPQLRKEG